MIAHPTKGNEQQYDYTDMLGFCAWLNLLVRQSKDCPIACLAQAVNVVRFSQEFCPGRGRKGTLSTVQIAPILTKPDGILLQTIYYPYVRVSPAGAEGD